MTRDRSRPSLSIVALSKRFDSQESILDNVSLELFPGQVTLVCGPSGSGKSTLLQLLGLITKPDSGRVFIDGLIAYPNTPEKIGALRNQYISMVLQNPAVIGALTAEENVALAQYIKWRRCSSSKVRSILTSLAIDDIARKPARYMSGGQKQRIALAQALSTAPKMLLCDEPTSMLDEVSARQAIDVLHDLTQRLSLTTIIATHDPRLESIADRILRIERGAVNES